jgi:hypothetical protein
MQVVVTWLSRRVTPPEASHYVDLHPSRAPSPKQAEASTVRCQLPAQCTSGQVATVALPCSCRPRSRSLVIGNLKVLALVAASVLGARLASRDFPSRSSIGLSHNRRLRLTLPVPPRPASLLPSFLGPWERRALPPWLPYPVHRARIAQQTLPTYLSTYLPSE